MDYQAFLQDLRDLEYSKHPDQHATINALDDAELTLRLITNHENKKICTVLELQDKVKKADTFQEIYDWVQTKKPKTFNAKLAEKNTSTYCEECNEEHEDYPEYTSPLNAEQQNIEQEMFSKIIQTTIESTESTFDPIQRGRYDVAVILKNEIEEPDPEYEDHFRSHFEAIQEFLCEESDHRQNLANQYKEQIHTQEQTYREAVMEYINHLIQEHHKIESWLLTNI